MKTTFNTRFLLSVSMALLIALVAACKKDTDTVPRSSAKAITSFTFGSVSPDVVATVSGNTIIGTLPLGTSLSSLAPTIVVSDKATVSPASGVAQDFSKPVIYTVTAEDGTTQAYTATMTVAQSVHNGLVYVGNLDGLLVAIDAATGAKKWEFKAGDAINATPHRQQRRSRTSFSPNLFYCQYA
ncbi:DUF5018 domain-containing protein [Fibrella forsythiae]|uniref:DUF5018 domain-containing protein n=1 Tax=Fibrella forsythiae TaxID=2817061 RepID=A0ABS3JR87_9BACT|nr:DUF5018 domain-containing protein [Fibrella forsythiae]MBO0952509.1 DUF5018 domain-containing protein [Fibrella forsythiae]